MRMIYVGAADSLAEAVIGRLRQEGSEVYLLSDRALARKKGSTLTRRYYRNIQKGGGMEKILRSILPDCVVFAGEHYMSAAYCEAEEEDVSLLSGLLRGLSTFSQAKVVLLSSVEVYGETGSPADESCPCRPATRRGLRFLQEEQMLDMYKQRFGLDTVILRVSQLYGDQVQEGGADFLSAAFDQVSRPGEETSLPNEILQPLHVSDLADAVKRIIDAGRQPVYNVCGSFRLPEKDLYDCVGAALNTAPPFRWEEARGLTLADSGLIKREQEWTDFRDLKEQLARGEISYTRLPARKTGREKQTLPTELRRLVENLVVFTAFFIMNVFCRSHGLFSQIHWLMIYVVLISLFFGIRQSSLAVILASCAYLFSQDLSLLEMNNFYSYAGSVLAITEFVFFGLAVSYTTDMLREELRNRSLELKMLREEHEDLKAINDENVLIKNEYEERLLDSKQGLPKLYHMVGRLMVVEPDRIFMEIMTIVSELARTDTVAVYRVNEGRPYLRLINALNGASAEGGKTWDLTSLPHIREALDRGELYQSPLGSGEPDVTLPVLHQGKCVAAIVVKKLPYESQTLYHINLLKTLALLLQDAVGRALDYEKLSREEQYLEGLDVLKPEPFRKAVGLALEKSEKYMTEYCVAEVTGTGSLEDIYRAIAPALRITDYLGTDESGRFYVLLNNTGPGDLDRLGERLIPRGVALRPVKGSAAPV